jgi:hypothetical protein
MAKFAGKIKDLFSLCPAAYPAAHGNVGVGDTRLLNKVFSLNGSKFNKIEMNRRVTTSKESCLPRCQVYYDGPRLVVRFLVGERKPVRLENSVETLVLYIRFLFQGA